MTAQPTVKSYCNQVALAKGLDPGGQATPFDTLLLLEAPLPWRRDMYNKAGTMPPEVIELFELYGARYRETGVWPPSYLFLIAPDESYSRPGWRRVILFQRDAARIANFARTEYLVPEAEAGRLVWNLAEEPAALADFEQWQTAAAHSTRDLLVCTHGTVDAACAKFGFPLYYYLRHTHATRHRRVWRVSHFGGHVFAPTLMDMPSGHFWAYVEESQAIQIVRRDGPVADLRGHYRGWAGLPNGFLQAAEREMWLREGWPWFDWPKCGTVVAQDTAANPAWAEVSVVFDDGSGQHTYVAHVELADPIKTIHTTHQEEQYAYPQYRITWLERTS